MAHVAISRLFLAGLAVLALGTGGCRAGDPDSCIPSQNACTEPGDRDAADIAFSSRGYESCTDAVNDNGCGIDAENLRRCVDSLPTPLCVGLEYQFFSPERLFETTRCADALDTFLACEDEDSNRSSRSSSSYDDHWYDD